MTQTITIHDRRVIYLSYEEGDYPGWAIGQVVQSPLRLPEGPIYCFTGTATVEGVVQNASRRYDVQVAHVPDD